MAEGTSFLTSFVRSRRFSAISPISRSSFAFSLSPISHISSTIEFYFRVVNSPHHAFASLFCSTRKMFKLLWTFLHIKDWSKLKKRKDRGDIGSWYYWKLNITEIGESVSLMYRFFSFQDFLDFLFLLYLDFLFLLYLYCRTFDDITTNSWFAEPYFQRMCMDTWDICDEAIVFWDW